MSPINKITQDQKEYHRASNPQDISKRQYSSHDDRFEKLSIFSELNRYKRLLPAAFGCLSTIRLFPNRLSILALQGPLKLIEFNEIERIADFQTIDHVLDIGCGIGIQTAMIAKRCRNIVGIDISEEAIFYANMLSRQCGLEDKITFMRTNLFETEFEHNSFDKAVSFCVLEHIPKYREALSLIRKWLRPGGNLVISVDSLATISDREALERHRLENYVAEYFNQDSLRSALEDAGYIDIMIFPILRSSRATRPFLMKRPKNLFYLVAKQLIEYPALRYSEANTQNIEKGIFLIARATVPPK